MHPSSLSRRFRIFLALVLIAFLTYIFATDDSFRDTVTGSTQGIVIGILIVGILVGGALWKYSSPYWKLRDKMVSTFTDGTYGNKSSNFRAISIGICVVLAVIALIGVYVIASQ